MLASKQTVAEGYPISYTATHSGTATYDFNGQGINPELWVGTSQGSYDVLRKIGAGEGTFQATAGNTYYMEVIPGDPEPDPDPCTDPICQQNQSVASLVSSGASVSFYTGKEFLENIDTYQLTTFHYNDIGRLTEIRHPNYYSPRSATNDIQAYVEHMTYNGRSELTEQTSPDSGKKTFYYDTQGNVRFYQDERGRTEGYYLYIRYDEWARTTEQGKVTGTWDNKLNRYAMPTIN
ncbi:MAG: hypothetical protein WBB45_05095 [Cyclobacteriaceae bacterium]